MEFSQASCTKRVQFPVDRRPDSRRETRVRGPAPF